MTDRVSVRSRYSLSNKFLARFLQERLYGMKKYTNSDIQQAVKGKEKYSCTLSLTSTLGRRGWITSHPAALLLEERPGTPRTEGYMGWAPI
jgi:hypothetical protein